MSLHKKRSIHSSTLLRQFANIYQIIYYKTELLINAMHYIQIREMCFSPGSIIKSFIFVFFFFTSIDRTLNIDLCR
jgi:hypothetical protein